MQENYFSGWEVEEIEKMRKLKLSILDIVNLILMVIGLILLAQRLTSPQFILPFGLIALVEEPLVILWAIGAVSEVVSLVFKSRTAKISTPFLLAFTMTVRSTASYGGTYLLQDIPCEYYRAEWGQIRWLRAFLGQFEEENREGGK